MKHFSSSSPRNNWNGLSQQNVVMNLMVLSSSNNMRIINAGNYLDETYEASSPNKAVNTWHAEAFDLSLGHYGDFQGQQKQPQVQGLLEAGGKLEACWILGTVAELSEGHTAYLWGE